MILIKYELYKKAVKISDNNKKIVLGLTYDNYHNITKGVHGNGHYRKKNISLKYCFYQYNVLGLLLLNIISIIFEIKKLKKDEFLLNLHKQGDNFNNVFEIKFKVGDLVIFKGKKYEIKELKISDYGYISYLIYIKIGIWSNEQYVPQMVLKPIS